MDVRQYRRAVQGVEQATIHMQWRKGRVSSVDHLGCGRTAENVPEWSSLLKSYVLLSHWGQLLFLCIKSIRN